MKIQSAGQIAARHNRVRRPRCGELLLTLALLLALAPATAQAATQAFDDPSDAPGGPFGRADLRRVAWEVDGASANLTIGIDASTYGSGERSLIGVHVLIDAGGDGIADREIVATRDADGVAVDLVLRGLDGTLSTVDCQDLAGKATAAAGTVSPTIAGGLETFTFSFDPTLVPGRLSAFRWAAFGQAPSDGAQAGPWDLAPDAANPDPAAANPGDRRCNSDKSGLRVRMSQGTAFPNPPPPIDSGGIVTGTTGPDADGDSVLDAADSCTQLAGSSANGCPDVARRLTLAYDAANEIFKGILRPAGGCAAAERATVFMIKPGADRKLGATTTRQSGKFTLKRSARAGRYYAIAGARTIAGVGNCLAEKSKRVDVRS